jgi:hypothetical protein
VNVSGFMLVGGVVGYYASTNAIKDITLKGDNTINGSLMAGGIVGGGFCDIINCTAAADVNGGPESSTIGILAGGMEDCSLISCSVTGGSISFGDGSYGIGGLSGCAFLAPEVKDCSVSNVTIAVGENCVMIGGLVGYTGNNDNSNPTIIDHCAVNNVTISASGSAERIGGVVGSGFYLSAYAEYYPEPSAFIVRNSSSSGKITGGNLVGRITGYTYDNSTVEATCTSTMIGAYSNTGANKDTADLSALK